MTRTAFPGRLRLTHQLRRETDVRRRNGKLQSCEPCRKGKLRCDHMMPSCGRCTRRNKQEQCVYHPAPLTKPNALPTPETTEADDNPPLLVSSSGQNVPVSTTPTFPPFEVAHEPQTSSLRTHNVPTASSSLLTSTTRDPPRPTDSHLPYSSQSTGAFWGLSSSTEFISHSAILAENEPSIGILPPSTEGLTTSNISQTHIDKGAVILSLLKDLPQFEMYVEKWFSFARGAIVIEPMMKIWMVGIWSTWRKVLEGQKPEDLRKMSEKVWINTIKPLSSLLNRNTSPREFCTATTGEGLRWEIIGLILDTVGIMAMNLSDGDPIFCSHDDFTVDRSALALKVYNGSDGCITFCNDLEIINDLYLWLLYGNTVLANSMSAKGGYRSWQKSSALASALLACGLHQKIEVNDKTPFFITEIRKRLFVCSYNSDKNSSSFNGRPPRMTRQYCQLQLPLDLTDAQLMAEGHELESALASLDADGWNTHGGVMHCTFARIFASNALILEEILEMSLGALPVDEVVRRAADIEARAIQAWENIPPFLRLEDKIIWDRRRAPVELLFLAHTRLGDLEHHFLLQRTLIKKAGTDSTKLLSVARDMFGFILLLLNNREVLREFQSDVIHMYCMSGIPSAAVIAVELLHQEQDPTSASAIINPLPRSDTIQDLSVFVSCLGSVRPENGGYAICDRGRRFLKKVLDTILSPASSAGVNSTSSVNNGGDPSFTTPLFQTGSDGDFVRWLESMEWDQESWINFN
ncbi:hypothetical protein K491DRAFT_414301 [Lophiostoma macrostomum CBS 122681]|uniref:Zn(2)-C6 fungal-type domain-containing protein n=1 Tax=Lophiostoma macrostomum CBS 122681 TaxID=1314788 RepID=A0A6A6T7L8_9PLEO|nr:hypothetical protein K491DRAFT_414301 [Lophiostoma macrostomum CBS 122681]